MELDKDHLSNTAVEIITAVTLVTLASTLIGVYILGAFERYRNFLEWFYGLDWERVKAIAAIIFIIIDLAFVWCIGTIARRLRRLNKKPVLAETEVVSHEVTVQTEVRENWEHIRELANSSNPSDWNMAVLRADALLEDALADLGYEGETIAERLAIVDATKLPSLDRAWSAHRLRNAIAHDPLEQHTRETILYALRSYEQAFKELGVL